MNPLLIGGNQERGLRAGTESVHNICGMELAFIDSYNSFEKNKNYILDLKTYFIEKISNSIPDLKFNGSCVNNHDSTYSILNICLPVSKDKSILLEFNLDLKGIACSRGSACQSGSSVGSHVLNSILKDSDLQKPSLRFSFSKYNNKTEIDKVVEVLSDFVNSN